MARSRSSLCAATGRVSLRSRQGRAAAASAVLVMPEGAPRDALSDRRGRSSALVVAALTVRVAASDIGARTDQGDRPLVGRPWDRAGSSR